ncbi:MAG: phosphoglycerate kinase [bacterium]
MDFKGKRVLVRIDANVPIKKGKVVDGPHGRIARSAVGLDWLLQRGARVIVLTHIGRPDGKRVSAYSVRPVVKRLSELLKVKVRYCHDISGPKAQKAVDKLKNGEVLVLENVRFDPREKENAPSFAEALASLGDIYVNDAFASSHRSHASIDSIASELPSYSGLLLANEVGVLEKAISHQKKPFLLVVGGFKITTKLPVIKNFLSQVDGILTGGALATVLLKAQGVDVGASLYDKEGLVVAKELLKKGKDKLWLPEDVVVAKSFRKDARMRVVSIKDIKKTDKIVDIGPVTIRRYQHEIDKARTIVWNGPFGYCEVPAFCSGTEVIAQAIAKRTGRATTIVGGGDTTPVVERLGLADQFTLLSTGGGAMLDFLAGEKLPGLEALKID